MKDWNELYQRNKLLDEMFDNKYKNIEPRIFEKNCIELIVEICELANETKFFKYWTIKKPDLEKVKEELADCYLMSLYFFNYLNIDEITISNIVLSNDIIIAFNELIRSSTNLINGINETLVKDIFTSLLNITQLLNINEDGIIKECLKKIIKNEERLVTNY